MSSSSLPTPHEHLAALDRAIVSLAGELERLERWGERLAHVLLDGGRLLVAGNGGSAAEAQHLTAELVGRYRDERVPLSAIALHADTSTLTALTNDYGIDEMYARQVRAHGRHGDVLLALSTSGRSTNVIRAVEAAARLGMTTWAITGRRPNPLAEAAHESIAVNAEQTAVAQEAHLVAVHLLAEAVDREVHGLVGLRIVNGGKQ